MELSKIIELLSFTIPSIITGSIAYLFFLSHTQSEEKKIKLTLSRENKKNILPIKLQAYERMTLYLERINPSKLLIRVTSINNDKQAYTLSLINTIEQEFEHNLTQQIYISEKCWSVIIASKNATIQLIKKTSEENSIVNAQELRENILQNILKTPSPTNTALAFIKDEVRSFL
ncbi:MAG: hypothetical protein HKP59_00635 [Lutibacter sp.]|uniref:DUF7935 family protein n=1 Tax=Lutibacter sp. TaxID=1925666 RepID=UPI001816E2F0|nr:hypothetical protein [Lutibacter sp.]MBT8316110.1 hypothetical protein [Lutibacter sp.]NNJ56970.1 hypothetical protein [Lutibacter sp.]